MRILRWAALVCVAMAVGGIGISLLVAGRFDPSGTLGLVAILGIVGLWLCLVAFWVVCLVEILRLPDPAWEAAGEEQARWIIRLVLLGWIAALLYVRTARPRLLAARSAGGEQAGYDGHRASPRLAPSRPPEQRLRPPM